MNIFINNIQKIFIKLERKTKNNNLYTKISIRLGNKINIYLNLCIALLVQAKDL